MPLSLLDRPLVYFAKRDLRARRSAYYFDLAMSLEDRVPLYSTLKKYEARARRRNRGESLLYGRILRSATKGSLADALEGVAPPSELMLLDAAQVSGDASVSAGLKFLSDTVEKTERMSEAVKKAVNYPVVLFLIFCAVLVGFSVYAVPVLAEIMSVDKWPTSGKILYSVSQAVQNYGIYLFVAIVALAILFAYSLGHWTGDLRRRFDRYLPYSIYRDYSGAMLIVSLASLMRTGISLRSSLERASKYSDPWLRWHVRQILKRLSSTGSANFGMAFATGVLNQELEDRVADASERRDPVAAFVKIGVGSIDRISLSIEKSAGRLNSAMIVVCGICLASMMLAFMATTQQLNSAIRTTVQQSAGR